MQHSSIQQDSAGPGRKVRAFENAARNSARVRFLRRLIVVGAALGSVAIVLVSLFDPFRVVGATISIGAAGLNGTRVTMQQPKMSGFQKDGRAYSMRAEAGVQDIRNPTVLELKNLTADIGLSDKGTARVTAPSGIYDSTAETMDMRGPVKMKNDSGYDLTMKSARIEFKTNRMSTAEPVTVVAAGGSVNADSMVVLNNERRVVFEGNVLSVMNPGNDETKQNKKEANR